MADDLELSEIERLAEAGRIDVAQQRLKSYLDLEENRSLEKSPKLALLAERLGLVIEATRLWRSVLEAEPGRLEALERLAALYQATGDLEAALAVVEKRLEAGSDSEEWMAEKVTLLVDLGRLDEARSVVEELSRARDGDDPLLVRLKATLSRSESPAGSSEEEELPVEDLTDGDVVRFVHLFQGREDIHARMWCDGNERVGYSPVREPLTPLSAKNHLLGNTTLGVYVVRLDGSVAFLALDLDIQKHALKSAAGDLDRARELREKIRSHGARLASQLHDLGLDPLMESSGYKGRHLWVFLDPPQPAGRIHNLGKRLLRVLDPRDPDLGLEFFPKQGAAEGKLGNLIKLPLGIHLKTGRRSLLLDATGKPLANPFARLRQIRSAGEDILQALETRLGAASVSPVGHGPAAPVGPPPKEEHLFEEPEIEVGPAPPPPGPAWTEADFELDPAVSTLLGGCELLNALVRRILEHRQVSADEIAALRTSLGHLPSGVLATNYLFELCSGVPGSSFLKSRLAGNPASCQRLRQRLSSLLGEVRCECTFDSDRASYPTPLLHLEGMKPVAAAPSGERVGGRDPSWLGRRLGWLERRLGELQEEADSVREALVAHLRATGGDHIALEEGSWHLVEKEGVACLEWEPKDGRSDDGAPDS